MQLNQQFIMVALLSVCWTVCSATRYRSSDLEEIFKRLRRGWMTSRAHRGSYVLKQVDGSSGSLRSQQRNAVAACNDLAEIREDGTLFGNIQYSQENNSPVECKWLIRAQQGKVIAVTVENLYTGQTSECRDAALTIYNGATERAPILMELCGESGLQTAESTQNYVLIKFTASDNEPSSFTLIYNFVS